MERAIENLSLRLPGALQMALGALPDDLTDLRLRPGRPAQRVTRSGEALIGPPLGIETIRAALNALAKHSLYAWEEELKQGFLTLEDGCRVGVCGRFVSEGGQIRALVHIGSVSIRIAREIKGAADGLMRALYAGGRPQSALILSPPGMGKTTLLRDIARQLSNGTAHGRPVRVAIGDERCELAACAGGVPTLDVGARTDVMDGCPKRLSMPIMVRAMSPDVIVTDELGHPEDADAVREAMRCGVAVIASAHAADYRSAVGRAGLSAVMAEGLFDRIVLLSGIGSPASVMDASGRPIA